MMPNKPTTLRDELIKLLFLEIDAIASEDDYRQYILSEEEIHKLITRIEDLAVSTHSTELVSKIEGLKETLGSTPDTEDKKGLKPIDDLQMIKGYKIALDQVISLINQEK